MEEISFAEFQKLDLRVAEIKKAEDHPNADKLVVMTVDIGDEERIDRRCRQGDRENKKVNKRED